ncbi:hypothetical protein J437_LFUL006272 [Ladona fulva]|uniref:GPI ethanolamine phosphate transferase 1 n=1 Tax=Ladona fulva TaxID=123851 RepID=A0A8K0NX70_LADFU|nr:hypothetical protein J437_LFUL006272 [Ladona fulva]
MVCSKCLEQLKLPELVNSSNSEINSFSRHKMKIIFLSFAVHVVFLVSVFDIYFTTPVIHGIPEQINSLSTPAKRLVLFVADGMRADTFFRLSKTEAPFLRNIIEKRGTWGVSHTRVPTESRPGHVAVIAGLYEDPSAIMKGWKENPVEFDSVFNRSTYTWAWGSPDILPMFSKACGNRMWIETYSPEDQDFSGGKERGPSWLDEWVYDRFKSFIEYVGRKINKNEEGPDGGHQWGYIQDSGIVFFLHLLASDTAGHIFKPHSREYQENVNMIDSGIRYVVNLVESFYDNDGRTAYVFTSDHGMTDWGSHGAGDDSETQTPLVIWGAGVPQPIAADSHRCDKNKNFPNVNDEQWNLSHLCRNDVWQADIAPLMSTLVGTSIPVNSVGYLRRAYLNFSQKELAEASFMNARQILAQHTRRRFLIEQRQRSWSGGIFDYLPSFYRASKSFPPEEEESRVETIRYLIDKGHYEKAVIAECDELFELALHGLEYHHRYHRPLLLASLSFAFLGWISLLIVAVLHPDTSYSENHQFQGKFLLSRDSIFVLLAAVAWLYLFILHAPLQYYIYCLLPVALWWQVVKLLTDQRKTNTRISWKLLSMKQLLSPTLYVAAYAVGIEILVISFFHRWILSLGMLGLACSSFITNKHNDPNYYSRNAMKILLWSTSCFILGIFPLTPVIGKDVNSMLVMTAGWLFILLGILSTVLLARMRPRSGNLIDSLKRLPHRIWFQLLVLIPLAMWNISKADQSFVDKEGLPLFCQTLTWILSGSSLGLPLLMEHHWHKSNSYMVMNQLMSICLSVAVPFLLLSVNHEGIFLFALALNVHSWVLLETTDQQEFESKKSNVTMDDFRRAYIFIFLIITSFFGTGNVASINSFDPAWVRRFLSIFSPHAMGALILAKTCFPFLIVSCAFRAINLILKVPPKQLFLVVLAFSDAAGLHFLHLVKDKGSWLDIGSSLSHFVILETMVLFLLILYGLSCILIPHKILSISSTSRLSSSSVKVTVNYSDRRKER